MGFEKWNDKIKKAELPEDEWEELITFTPSKALGPTVIANYLQKDGDVIEIDLEGKDRRCIGNFIRALNIVNKKQKLNLDFLLRYSKDYKRAYIKRIG